ncbi:MAG: DNA repair protein RecN [Parvularcula sp.]
MIKTLSIENIVLIKTLTIDLDGGLTALTGETGAGKSILLDAIGLAVGGKGDRGLVRHGAKKGAVRATFALPPEHPARRIAEEMGISLKGKDVTLGRVQFADGRTRALIDDTPCSVAALAAVGGALVELHSQHQSVGLLNPASHAALLDSFGAHGRALRTLSVAYRRWRQAVAAAENHRARAEKAQKDEEYLRHCVEELERLAPEPGEDALLAERRAAMMAQEKIEADIASAAEAVEHDRRGMALSVAGGHLVRAMGRIEGDARRPLEVVAAQIERAEAEYCAAQQAILDLHRCLDLDTDELNRTEERLFAIRAAGRKHGCRPDDLYAVLVRSRADLAALENARELASELDEEVKARAEDYQRCAEALSKRRKRAAKRLKARVKQELEPLRLGEAVFDVAFEPRAKPAEAGLEAIEFRLATNPGVPCKPLATVASGGELSRLILALKAALASGQDKSVLIFDEVDAGVGGAVADAVGERLGRIAERAQVLVVTHSPQVAARADQQAHVTKRGERRAATQIAMLTEAERIEEIARMLSGATVTDLGRQAAAELMNAARVTNPALVNGTSPAKTAA